METFFNILARVILAGTILLVIVLLLSILLAALSGDPSAIIVASLAVFIPAVVWALGRVGL